MITNQLLLFTPHNLCPMLLCSRVHLPLGHKDFLFFPFYPEAVRLLRRCSGQTESKEVNRRDFNPVPAGTGPPSANCHPNSIFRLFLFAPVVGFYNSRKSLLVSRNFFKFFRGLLPDKKDPQSPQFFPLYAIRITHDESLTIGSGDV
jgi:hypothetical protein